MMSSWWMLEALVFLLKATCCGNLRGWVAGRFWAFLSFCSDFLALGPEKDGNTSDWTPPHSLQQVVSSISKGCPGTQRPSALG